MSHIIPIMTLPVYRLTREKYFVQRAQHVEQQMYGGPDGEFKREFAKKNPDWVKTFSEILVKQYGGNWEYNEIIGFIELHFCGMQVRGEYFENNKRKQVRTRKKQFDYITHKLAPEINIPQSATSNEIEAVIEKYIKECRQELRIRYVDDSAFTNLKGCVDWLSLLKKTHH